MSDAESQLRERAESDGVRFFFAMFVDMHGKPCAKMIPVEATDVLTGGGAGFAGFAAGPMGQSPADPDMIAVPDPASYTLTPWQPGLAVLQCDIHVEGQPWPYTPRLILKRMLDKVRDRDLVYNVGCEAEYFLVRRRDGGGVELADPLDTAEAPCYDAKGLTRMFGHLSTVSTYMNQLGWANYANDHEDANGQFEQNFAYADALTSADRLIFYRYMIHTVAHNAGLAATFMPKPFGNLTASGWRPVPAPARPTRTWPWRAGWLPGSTASTAGWTRASRTATSSMSCRPSRSLPVASGPCRRPCCTPPTNWSPTTCCARRWA